MANYAEYQLQKSIARYLSVRYPDVMFLSDAISNVNLTAPQKVRNKAIQKHDFSCPDMMVFKPSNGYHGLFLELKQKSPYKLNGELKKQVVKNKNKAGLVVEIYDHLEEQERTLRRLSFLGYKAEFCWSLDQAIKIIDEYLK